MPTHMLRRREAQAEGYDGLNRQLLDACAQDDARRRQGHMQRVVDDFAEEQSKLRALPAKPFDTAEVARLRVTAKACVQVRRNFYSVPVHYVGRQVEVRVQPAHVEVIVDGKHIARHVRRTGVSQWRVELDHYLELLHVKPLALRQSLPLRQARQRGERAHWRRAAA